MISCLSLTREQFNFNEDDAGECDIILKLLLLLFNMSSVYPPSLPCPLSHLPSVPTLIQCSPVYIQKRPGLSRISANHGIPGCSKTRHLPSS